MWFAEIIIQSWGLFLRIKTYSVLCTIM